MESSAKGAKSCDFVRLGPKGHCGPRLGLRSQMKDTAEVTTIAKDQISVTIKRESSDEDFKEYAETAMNELLGWYGYANNKPEQDKPANDKFDKTDPAQLRVVHPRGSIQLESRRSSAHSSGTESPKCADTCGWCGKSVEDTTALSSNDALFCSEMCFSQSRRANFKKSRTCDWCKHVRRTVSYVDFQDGASQLQFCSDKCLNQYKMHIFCRETRAHLEMHPHLVTEDTTSGLITPDLWMRNCRSPGSRVCSPPAAATATPGYPQDEPQTSPLPLITVAHPSKLLSCGAVPSAVPADQEKNGTHPRRKRLRKRPLNKTPLPTTNDEAQDLRVHLRRSFERVEREVGSASTNQFPELAARLCASDSLPTRGDTPLERRSNGNGINTTPHTVDTPDVPIASTPPSTPSIIPPTSQSFAIGGVLPPVTVMVPYPILLPVPIPIPIPLPISAFLAAANLNQNKATLTLDATENSIKNSDDEEIVVDDDSRLHNGVHENKEPENETPTMEPDADLPTTRLRKRNHEMTPPQNYKHKKSLSV